MIRKETVEKTFELLSEYDEYTKNKEFNELLNEGDLGEYQVIFKTPEGEEHSLERIASAIFSADRARYRQLVEKTKETMKHQALRIDQYSNNENVFDRLVAAVKQKASIVPFVGAGFTVAAGCPAWSEYIVSQAIKAQMDEAQIRARLKVGEHEEVMDEVIQAQTLPVFKREFASEFEGARIAPALSPATELTQLFSGSMVTTNFDRVLENCHQAIEPFIEKVIGNENSGRFLKALYRGEKYLLKLHGNIDDQQHRVLTKAEYDRGYGQGDVDYNLPIPKMLKKIFGNFSFLFLGCSLVGDRYLRVLKSVYDEGADYMPEHFAILSAPDDEAELADRDQFLAGHGISPIWFAEGDWAAPEDILKLLNREAL